MQEILDLFLAARNYFEAIQLLKILTKNRLLFYKSLFGIIQFKVVNKIKILSIIGK